MQQVHDIHYEVHSIFEGEIAKLSGLQKVSSTEGKMDSEFDGQDRMALRAAWKLQGILALRRRGRVHHLHPIITILKGGSCNSANYPTG